MPLRTCTSCGRKAPKLELIRIVRTPFGKVQVDGTSKLNGRGAYLCTNTVCWEHGLKPKRLPRLEYALRGRIPPEDKEYLLSYAATLSSIPPKDCGRDLVA